MAQYKSERLLKEWCINETFCLMLAFPKIDDAGQAAAVRPHRRHVVWRKLLSRPHRSRLAYSATSPQEFMSQPPP